jgi:hypothetical protein
MADYSTDYMKRIAFLDGQVLHDFHLNLMQKNVAEAIKLQTTVSKYDFYLMVSSYNMYFVESFVDKSNCDTAATTAQLNTLSFSISSGSWESNLLTLPDLTEEICLVSNFEDNIAQGAYVKFYYRTAKGNTWIPITPDMPTYLPVQKRDFQIKAECTYTGVIRPAVYDFALLWK